MSLHEIVLPETEPETEWILGRAVRKVSPLRKHALIQRWLSSVLAHWAGDRGEVGTEWRFRLAPPGQIRRPLVPDIAFVTHDRLRPLPDDEIDAPPLAPDVVVEILSPGNQPRHVAHKVAVYLSSGSRLVVVVDPAAETVRLCDRDGERTLKRDDVLAHRALPGFALPLRALFAVTVRKR